MFTVKQVRPAGRTKKKRPAHRAGRVSTCLAKISADRRLQDQIYHALTPFWIVTNPEKYGVL